MLILRHVSRRPFSNTKIPLSLAYPYQYTIQPDQFDLHDIRFKELPFSRELAKPEKEHVEFMLQRWQTILNKNASENEYDKQYILNCLKLKCKEFKDILKQSQIQIQFKLKTTNIVKSSGYLEIKPERGVSLKEEDLGFIHEYDFTRQKQCLFVKEKEKKSLLSEEEQLKEDLNKEFNKESQQIRQKLKELKVSKHAVLANKFVTKLMSIGKPQEKRGFESYYIIEQIKSTMECKMIYQGQTYQDKQMQFDSKWLYHVQNLQSQDMKKHRKRILFDFQFWNRGNFFPVKDFTEGLL